MHYLKGYMSNKVVILAWEVFIFTISAIYVTEID